MLYILTLAAILLGLIKKRSNIVFVTMLVFLWLMLGWSSGNADYSIHLGRFNNYELASVYTEILYTALMRLANQAGLMFQQFLPIVMLAYVLIIGFIVKKVSAAPAFVIALYIIFPACIEAVQIRYTLASAFVLLGFYFLLKDDSSAAETKYVGCIIIATLMHVSTIIFILFIVTKRLSVQKTVIYTAMVIGIIYLSRLSWIVTLIGKLPGMTEKVSRVLTSAASRYTNITVIKTAHRCLIFFAIFMILIYYLKKRNEGYDTGLDLSCIENVKKANIISLVILPLLFYSVDFYRIQQTLSLLNYCALSYFCLILPKAYSETRNRYFRNKQFVTTKKRLGYMTACVLMTIINLYYLVLNSSNIMTVFKPFFENNLFFWWG